MSDCDFQENIKEPIEYEPAMAATTTENPIVLSITTVAAAVIGIFFSLRYMGVRQHVALITSTSLVWLMSWYR